MYSGVSSIAQAKPANSYADARRNLEAAMLTPTGKRRQPKGYPEAYPLGAHFKSVTSIRERSNGDIVLRLYNTDVVTWHPDNSFSIITYPTKTTAEFIGRFSPVSGGGESGVLRWYATLRPEDNGRSWEEMRPIYRDYWRGQLVCKGDATFRPVGDGLWMPDEDTCDTILMPRLDRKEARRVSTRYNLATFDDWLAMAPRHMRVEHRKEDMPLAAQFLLERDFKSAAMHLPLIEENTKGWGVKLASLGIITGRSDQAVTMTSLQRFRSWLYDQEGLITRDTCKVMTSGQYDANQKRINALAKAGVYV